MIDRSTPTTNEEEVRMIANSIHMEVSDREIEEVINDFPCWVQNDPTSLWYEVIENMLYSIKNKI